MGDGLWARGERLGCPDAGIFDSAARRLGGGRGEGRKKIEARGYGQSAMGNSGEAVNPRDEMTGLPED